MSKRWKAIRENYGEENETYTGPGGSICPKCGNGRIDMFDHVNRSQKFTIHCWECNKVFILHAIDIIDPNITKAISILNHKGYKTYFSCEGHDEKVDENGKPVATAYILFRDPTQKSIISEHPLPVPWYLAYKGSDRINFVIRAKVWECSKEDWDARCERITEWAESLPEIECSSEFKYGYGSGEIIT